MPETVECEAGVSVARPGGDAGLLLTPDEFAALTGVSDETLARLEAYAELLANWSARINLVAASTLADPWRRHFLNSAQLHPLIPAAADSLIDLGSGAGFPGLVLAIMGIPGVELVEADARKCAFLREAARVAAASVTIRNARIESVAARPVSVVTARGCAPLDRLLVYSQRFIGPETVCLFPKGEQARQELAAAQQELGVRCHEPSEPHRSARRHPVLEPGAAP